MSKIIGSMLGILVFGVLSVLLPSAAQAERYQQYLNGNCVRLICNIDFPVVAAGTTLEITSFSCYLRISGADVYALQLLQINANASIGVAVSADLQYVDSISKEFSLTSESVYQSNDTIFAFANGGQRFRAQARLKAGDFPGEVAEFKQFACHISGQTVP